MDEIHSHISEISDQDGSLHHHNSVLHDDKDRLNQEISEMRKEYDELLLYFVSYRAKFQEQERRSFKKLKLNDSGADEDCA
ncbi:uncharacterized protein SPAPADRAFT_63444 [Spathaspora passalidarum NRRL Y-27907]|uniref:Uncharacterized protein n=1 Tax=Spathaspora passalidarum (strain NRRL Y-27907 / 11-Y1) TaxID=619300 RepID=G3AUQ9_SPAPN|nr:uncharacterized protein SPAPADRAFT_63444 [Spathaspora passalidarum NRRL Y-27907]EGW30615.1 hypothetical protein SPAPADRAFT_63444 [Spathaspora passalidarum NRRL Y-27907]